MIKGFLNLPWFLWAGFSLVLAVVWIYVGPHTRMKVVPGFRNFIIRWGHVLTWVLLAISFSLHGIDPNLNGIANMTALAGGVVYLLFMVMAFVVK